MSPNSNLGELQIDLIVIKVRRKGDSKYKNPEGHKPGVKPLPLQAQSQDHHKIKQSRNTAHTKQSLAKKTQSTHIFCDRIEQKKLPRLGTVKRGNDQYCNSHSSSREKDKTCMAIKQG